jgi:phage shock protein A
MRRDIADLKADIAKVDSALAPLDERTELLRVAYRELTSAYDKWIDKAAAALADGAVADVFLVAPELKLERAIGIAVAAVGEDEFIASALERVARHERGRQRMPAGEKSAALLKLHRRLYQLELDEEALVLASGEERRPDANAAAVLGVPLDVAEENNLLAGAR